jgi:hypothetical protein
VAVAVLAVGVLWALAAPFDRGSLQLSQIEVPDGDLAAVDDLGRSYAAVAAEAYRLDEEGVDLSEPEALRVRERQVGVVREGAEAAERAGFRACRHNDVLLSGPGVDPEDLRSLINCDGSAIASPLIHLGSMLLALAAAAGIATWIVALKRNADLLPWNRPRTRLLPPMFLAVAAILLPWWVYWQVVLARDAGYRVPAEPNSVHAGGWAALTLVTWIVVVDALVLLDLDQRRLRVLGAQAAVLAGAVVATSFVWDVTASLHRGTSTEGRQLGLVLGALAMVLSLLRASARDQRARAALVVAANVVVVLTAQVLATGRPGGVAWLVAAAPLALVAAPRSVLEVRVRGLLSGWRAPSGGAAFVRGEVGEPWALAVPQEETP